jgi:hypothetical protein
LHRVRQKSDTFVQKLNDSFANPSGSDPNEILQAPLPGQTTAADLVSTDNEPSKTD